MDLMTTEDAAIRLGVSTRRVRALIDQGDLNAELVGRMYLVTPESLSRLAAHRADGRSLSTRMAWAALLTDLGATGLDEVATYLGLSRTDRQRVLALRDRVVDDWSWLARRRASRKRFSVRDTYLDRLVSDSRTVRSGLSALDVYHIALTSQSGEAELYVSECDSEGLLSDYLARSDEGGRVIIHIVDEKALAHVAMTDRSTMSASTVGVDLAESEDSRTRRAGYELLKRVARG